MENTTKSRQHISLKGNRFGKLVVQSDLIKKNRRYLYLCKCDCGNTKIIDASSLRNGKTRSCGCLLKDGKNKPNYRGENEYYIDGEVVHVVLSNSDTEMLCDVDDWEVLKKHRWVKSNNGYAKTVVTVDGKHFNKNFHVMVMGKIDGKVVDHINRNRLDNRKINLRIVSQQVNAINSCLFRTNTSGIKGVRRSKNRWIAYIYINNRNKYLGSYKTIEEAASARKEAEEKYFVPLLKN